MSLSEIKSAVRELPPKELAELAKFIAEQNYALQEYSVTEAELDRFVRRTKQRIARQRKAGKMTIFSGDIEADIAD